jgi:signal transduction histidine kinase
MTEIRGEKFDDNGVMRPPERDRLASPEHGAESSPRRRRARLPGDASARFADVIARRGRDSRGDGDTLLNSIVLDATELLGASRVAMMLYDAKDDTVEILDIGTPAFPGRIFKLGEGVAGRVIQTGQPLLIEDYQAWPGKISGEVIGPPIVSAVAVPLRNGDISVGAMTAHSTDIRRRFTDRDAHVLEVFADIAMLALSHFSMSEELRTLNTDLEQMVGERTSALERSTEEITRKNEQLEELLAAIAQAQNEERWRIAQDIHDGTMQTLTGAIFELKALETSSSGPTVAKIRTVRELLHQLEVELRGVIKNLQPLELEEGGLAEAVKNEARHLQVRYGIDCRVRIVGQQEILPQPVEATALRIVKEALRNVQLHAAAARAEVEIHYLRPDVQIHIRDFGRGFDVDVATDTRSHFGISGMRRRAEGLGGSFALRSTPGRGTEIIATMPRIER